MKQDNSNGTRKEKLGISRACCSISFSEAFLQYVLKTNYKVRAYSKFSVASLKVSCARDVFTT